MQPLHFEREYVVPFPAAAVWPLLADTDRMNRALGLPAVDYASAEDPRGRPCLLATTRFAGVTSQWYEYPFSWREGEAYSVRREFLRGPLQWVQGGCELREADGRTHVKVAFDLAPRNVVGLALARLVLGRQILEGFRTQCLRIGEVLSGQQADPFPRTQPVELNVSRLDHKCRLLTGGHGFDAALVERLRRHLTTGHDEDVLRMRPFALADAWGVDRREVLRLFLHATAEGLLELSWNVLCPNCRVAKADFGTLRNLRAEAHCEVCRIDFAVDFDRLVELRFNVRADIRKAEAAWFCIGGPANTPHIVAQSLVGPGQQVRFTLPAGPDLLRLRVRESEAVARVFREDAAASASTVSVSADGIEPRSLTVGSTEGQLVVENGSAGELTVLLEREAWPTDACTAAFVSTLAEFRRLFSAEVLAPNLQVGIQNLAVLFSDLKGSTRFYQEVGDAQAFAVVRDHFDMLGRIVEKHDGTFVKTMGDAIMAVFLNGRDGLLAALEMQSAMRAWEDERVPDRHSFVKLGLHQGPVISVTLNDRLDYFGTTVNMAARVQAQSAGGDVVISQAVRDDVEVSEVLRQGRVSEAPFTTLLPGFAEPTRLWRLSLPQAAEDAVPMRRNAS